jgi:hypothetical protein
VLLSFTNKGKLLEKFQEVHMSFGDIGSIIKKVKGVDDGDKPKEQEQDKAPTATLSKDSQAFKLFSEGKKPIDVALR